MRRGVEIFMLLLAIVLWPPSAAGQPPVSPDSVDDEIIILLRPGMDRPQAPDVVAAINDSDPQTPVPGGLGEGGPLRGDLIISEVFRARGAAHERLMAEPTLPRAALERSLVLEYSNPAAIPGLLTALRANPNVELAVRNTTFRLHAAAGRPAATDGRGASKALPDDPFFPNQWALNADVLNLPAAWDLVDANVLIGVIDIGVEPGRADLEPFDHHGNFIGGNLRPSLGFNFALGNCDADELGFPNSPTKLGHGTHVTGIIGAKAGNGIGITGACENCPVVMTKVDQLIAVDEIARALPYLVDIGVQIVNMSFGRPGSCTNPQLNPVCQALEFAHDRGVLMVASAGNDRRAVVDFPASDPRVIGVGGIGPDKLTWDDSPNCPTVFNCPVEAPDCECGSNFGPEMEWMTPAKAVMSTVYTELSWITEDPELCGDEAGAGPSDDGFGNCTGTSMASPYAAAVVAHLLEANRLLAPNQIRAIIRRTASLR